MYRRIEDHKDHQHITTVNDAGEYEQIVRWNDGLVTSRSVGNIFKMGWASVKEFLTERKGFTKVI